MEFADIIRVTITIQESLNALTTDHTARHRILKLIQVAEDNDTVLTAEIIERELIDLQQAIEDAKEAEAKKKPEAASVQGREETEA